MQPPSPSGRPSVFVGVRLDEPTVRALDRFAVEHQPPNSRKVSRANVLRDALAYFLRTYGAGQPASATQQRSPQ